MNGDVVNGDLPKLPPPAKLKKEIRQRGKLVLETLWMLVLLVPTILLVLYRKVYPSLGKSLHGKVVLVSGLCVARHSCYLHLLNYIKYLNSCRFSMTGILTYFQHLN